MCNSSWAPRLLAQGSFFPTRDFVNGPLMEKKKHWRRGNREAANEHIFFISNNHCNVNKCQWEIKAGSLFSKTLIEVLFPQRLCLWGNTFIFDSSLWKEKWDICVQRHGTSAEKCKHERRARRWRWREKKTLSVTTGNPWCDTCVALLSDKTRGNKPRLPSERKRQGPALRQRVMLRVSMENDTGNKQHAKTQQTVLKRTEGAHTPNCCMQLHHGVQSVMQSKKKKRKKKKRNITITINININIKQNRKHPAAGSSGG